jgi:vancomycin permeability regulator SanA
MPRSAIVKTIFASVGAMLILYLAYQFISLRSQNSITAVPPSDCIVVLGAAVWAGGQPSPVLRDRLTRAAELYRQGVADKIICSGGVGKHPPAEAEVCKQFLLKAGVVERDIITEPVSASTSEQAVRIKAICDREGFRSVALVTSFFHEKRAIQLFSYAGFIRIEDARCTHERFEDLNFWVAREAAALTVMNWWHWAAMGAGLSILMLGYRFFRESVREERA